MDSSGTDHRTQVREFLTSRRARTTPEQAGLPFFGGNRRVAGLRREEVAMLAGVSVDYYTRVERGNLTGVSAGVLEAVAGALQLDEAERAHLFDLASASVASRPRRTRPAARQLRPAVQAVLDSMTNAPALVRNGRMDYLGANRLGLALYSEMFDSPAGPPNSARYFFLDPRSADFFPDWDRTAGDAVATLRTQAGRTPYDKALTDLVGELSTRSEEFRVRWAAHDVRLHRTGTKRLHHSVVGELELTYETFNLAADDGLVMHVYGAEPASPSAGALGLLASWAATEDQERRAAEQVENTPSA